MARQYWPNGTAIGSRLILGKGYGPEFEEPPREIVGIVGDVLDFDAKVPRPAVYVPMAQVTDGILNLLGHASSIAWSVRTRVEPHSLATPIRTVLEKDSGGLAATKVLSMDDLVKESTAAAGFQLTLLIAFGAAALLLTAIGIYGVMAYSVRQRTREIGIRLALGAESRGIQNMLSQQGVRSALLGLLAGLGAALWVARLLAQSLFGVTPWDPLTFTLAPAFLFAVVLLATWLPSRRVAAVQPAIALRHE